MTTAVVPLHVDLTAHEFEHACENDVNGCDEAAAWVIWGSHSLIHEPATVYSCDKHKVESEADMTCALRTHYGCQVCNWVAAGQLSEHFRAIRL